MAPRLAVRSALAVLVAVLAFAAPAAANPEQASVMQDDDQLLYRGDAVRDAALDRMKQLGVDLVRVTVLWEVVAQDAPEARYRGSDPSAYPPANWDKYDRLIRAAYARRIGVYFNPTAPGPRWAHPRTSDRKNRRTYRPRPGAFANFVAALGRRYSGSYPDENDGGQALPRVLFWSIFNEPNQGGWLTPQYAHSKLAGRRIPMSPVLYREIYLRAQRALEATGHGADFILIGETAPLGNRQSTSRSPVRPKRFIRELMCIRPDGTRYTGRAARARRCGLFQKLGPIRASGWAHHPYTKDLPPTRRDRHPDSITMANISHLGGLLDEMAEVTRGKITQSMTVALSEFGYETKPPDPFTRFGLAAQAEYLNVGDWLAYREPRVFAQTQFLLYDVPAQEQYEPGTKQHWFTYQSGLYFARGEPKPAAYAYLMPLVVRPAPGGQVYVWGQLRFLPNNTSGTVSIQFRREGETGDFRTIETREVTQLFNFYETRVPSPGPGTWRAEWTAPDGSATLRSREVPVG